MRQRDVRSTFSQNLKKKKDQSTETVKAAVTIVFDWYRSHGKHPKVLRTDFSSVSLSDDFRAWLLDKYGARVQMSAPYCHWQNAVERDVQTVLAGTSTLLHSQRWLRGDCWDLAQGHFLDLRNRSPSARVPNGRSPLQVITGEITDFASTHRFAFGDLLAVPTPGNTPSEAKTWKFDAKNELGIYVGNPDGVARSSLVYWPQSHSISVRLQAHKLDMTDVQFMSYYRRRAEMRDGSLPYVDVADATHDFRLLTITSAE